MSVDFTWKVLIEKEANMIFIGILFLILLNSVGLEYIVPFTTTALSNITKALILQATLSGQTSAPAQSSTEIRLV